MVGNKIFKLEVSDYMELRESEYEYTYNNSSKTALISANCNESDLTTVVFDDFERNIILTTINHPNITEFLQLCNGLMNLDHIRYVAVHNDLTKSDIEEIYLERNYTEWLKDKFFEIYSKREEENVSYLRNLLINGADGYELLSNLISTSLTKERFNLSVKKEVDFMKSELKRRQRFNNTLTMPSEEDLLIKNTAKTIWTEIKENNNDNTIDFSSNETQLKYNKIKKELDENCPYFDIENELDYNVVDEESHEITLSEFTFPENGVFVLSSSNNQSYRND